MLSSITVGPCWGSEDTDAILSCFRTPWTVTHQPPLSLGFSRQDIGVGCRTVLQGIFLIQGLKLCLSLKSPALAGRVFTTLVKAYFVQGILHTF